MSSYLDIKYWHLTWQIGAQFVRSLMKRIGDISQISWTFFLFALHVILKVSTRNYWEIKEIFFMRSKVKTFLSRMARFILQFTTLYTQTFTRSRQTTQRRSITKWFHWNKMVFITTVVIKLLQKHELTRGGHFPRIFFTSLPQKQLPGCPEMMRFYKAWWETRLPHHLQDEQRSATRSHTNRCLWSGDARDPVLTSVHQTLTETLYTHPQCHPHLF